MNNKCPLRSAGVANLHMSAALAPFSFKPAESPDQSRYVLKSLLFVFLPVCSSTGGEGKCVCARASERASSVRDVKPRAWSGRARLGRALELHKHEPCMYYWWEPSSALRARARAPARRWRARVRTRSRTFSPPATSHKCSVWWLVLVSLCFYGFFLFTACTSVACSLPHCRLL